MEHIQKQAIGYIRVSTVQQAEEGLSIEAQENKIRSWCEFNNYDLVNVYKDEGISGFTIDKRDNLKKALSSLKRGMALVAYSLSRVSRNTVDALSIINQINKIGADFVSITENIETTTATGRMHLSMLASFSQYERDIASERTKFVKQMRTKRQEYNGGWLPYGFRREDEESVKLVEFKPELEIVKLIKELREKGLSYYKISQAFTERNIFNRLGKPFNHKQIERIYKRI